MTKRDVVDLTGSPERPAKRPKTVIDLTGEDDNGDAGDLITAKSEPEQLPEVIDADDFEQAKEARLEKAWDTERDKLLLRNPTTKVLVRFEDQYKIALKCFRYAEWVILPPPLEQKLSPEEYCELLADDILEKQTELLRDAWRVALEANNNGALFDDGDEMLRMFERERVWWLPGDMNPRGRTMKDQARGLRFGGERAGIQGGYWRFRNTLGETGKAHAGLWVQHDSAGKITHRMAVKENYLYGLWDFEGVWDGPKKDRVPMEARIMELLKECENAANSLVGIFGHGIYERKRMYRVYMEFCPHGSLEDLIHAHQELEPSGYGDPDLDEHLNIRDENGNLLQQ